MLHCTILVALGANLPGPGGRAPVETCRWAVARLGALPGISVDERSGWYRSAPVPPSGQPDFVNGAVRLQGDVTPEAMLAALHAIEAEAGRARSVPNAARTLDLELLAVDGLELDTPGLVVPHPRLHLRPFVLAPLAEIAGEWVHPRLGQSVAAMLGMADMAGLERVADP